ncbi:MAG TPA: hypothetical protein VGJ44_07400 [Kribbellaceae bacterium]
MPDIWLASCAAWPTAWTDGPPIDAAFTALGVDARWAVWDDPAVDWAAAPLVAIRATWDYFDRYTEFLAWAERVAAATTLVNPLPVVRWNTRKDYLIDLGADGVPVVPTDVVPAGEPLTALTDQVVKPAVGGGGRGVVVVRAGESLDTSDTLRIAQPLVGSIRTEGEYSVFLLGGEPVAAVVKLPAGDEIRVHEVYGGDTKPTELTDELRGVALTAMRATERRFGVTLPYGRADLMRLDDGTLAVNELELVEPSLYCPELPEMPIAFAAAMRDLLPR